MSKFEAGMERYYREAAARANEAAESLVGDGGYTDDPDRFCRACFGEPLDAGAIPTEGTCYIDSDGFLTMQEMVRGLAFDLSRFKEANGNIFRLPDGSRDSMGAQEIFWLPPKGLQQDINPLEFRMQQLPIEEVPGIEKTRYEQRTVYFATITAKLMKLEPHCDGGNATTSVVPAPVLTHTIARQPDDYTFHPYYLYNRDGARLRTPSSVGVEPMTWVYERPTGRKLDELGKVWLGFAEVSKRADEHAAVWREAFKVA